MRWVFAIALVVGMLALIAWAMVQGIRGPGSGGRWGTLGRQAVAASVAFGMGGLSASYAGWRLGLAALAAVTAAVLAASYAGKARRLAGGDRG